MSKSEMRHNFIFLEAFLTFEKNLFALRSEFAYHIQKKIVETR